MIEFKEEKKEKRPLSPNALKIQRGLTGTGAVAGLWAGGLLGAEHGSLASGFEGGTQSVEKFKKYRKQDAAHEARRAHRYVEIEDSMGNKVYRLRDIVEPRSKGQALPIKERLANLGKGARNLGKESLLRGKFAAQDAAHGVGKWLTRSSLTRSIAIGGALGAGAGRLLGHFAGKELDKSQRIYSAEKRKTLQRKRENEIAKEHIRAQAMVDAVRASTAKQLSAKLDNLIQFAGGYVRTKAGVGKETGVAAHFNRAAGRYIASVPLTPVVGLPVGYLIDRARRKKNIIKTRSENIMPESFGKGKVLMSAKLDDLLEMGLTDRVAAKITKRWKPSVEEILAGIGTGSHEADEEEAAKKLPHELIAKLDKLIQFANDPRPRNSLGEYSQQQEGVADPNTMDKTYGTIKQGLSLGGAAAVGGAGALAGSAAAKGIGRAVKHVYTQFRKSRIKVP